MLKLTVLTLSVAAFAATLASASADARSSRKGTRHDNSYDRSVRDYGSRTYRSRSNTVAPNGLCQRDTGTPTSQLNFRNRCDTEEFWKRQEDRGRGFGF